MEGIVYIGRTRFWAELQFFRSVEIEIGISTSNYFLAQCVYNELTFQIIIILEWDIPIQRPIHTLS